MWVLIILFVVVILVSIFFLIIIEGSLLLIFACRPIFFYFYHRPHSTKILGPPLTNLIVSFQCCRPLISSYFCYCKFSFNRKICVFEREFLSSVIEDLACDLFDKIWFFIYLIKQMYQKIFRVIRPLDLIFHFFDRISDCFWEYFIALNDNKTKVFLLFYIR